MLETSLRFADLLLASLLVGTMFGIWLGFNPINLSPGAYIEQQQQAIRSLNVAMPLLGATCIVVTVALAVQQRATRQSWQFLVIAAAFLIVSGIVTRFLNQPINAEVMTWSRLAPPANWMDLRDRWWQWHIVRTLAGTSALVFIIVETLLSRKGV